MDNEQQVEWYSIAVTVGPEAAEAIEHAFNSLDALGTEINHLRKKNAETVTVLGYFNELPDEDRVQDELLYALRIYGLGDESILQLERSAVEKTDWLAEWKKHWRPTTIGRFVIAPPWSDVDEGDHIVIRIEPNMAFGTGTHETTQLCISAIDAHYVPGETFLDVGTGTGILAIAAGLLNLKSQISDFKFLAFDTDTDSITIARENADLNGVGGLIDFFVGSISEETAVCDFVCANVTLDVIEPLLDLLLSKTQRVLVLSGILVSQREEIVRALQERGVNNAKIESSGEWISVVVLKDRSPAL